MKGQTETIQLAVEILTPVHVGSGEELYRELDYVEQRGQVFVVDQNRTFNAIASGHTALDTLLQANPKLSDSVRLAGTYYGYPLPYLQGKMALPEKFREFIKDAMLHPYLPGSSIKGAIRTALLAAWLHSRPSGIASRLPRWDNTQKKPTCSPKMAATAITKYVFGSDPNKDLLRALHVGDANFQTSDLCLADVRWLNITRSNDRQFAKWRNMSNRKNENRWQDATGIYAETLAPTAIAAMSLQWDRFLLKDPNRWYAPQHSLELLPADFAGLCAKLNGHARHILEQEIKFFQRYKQQTIVEQCETLRETIQQTENAAYLRLAWGSGWRGMTGGWQDAETQEKMRGLYRLGKSENFPKTRRLAVQGNPRLPLGWIRLSPWSDETEIRAASQKTSSTDVVRSPWVEEQIAAIQEQHHASADEALRGQPLAKSWQAIEDGDLKQTALADIQARWQEKGWWDNPPPGKSIKKALQIYKGEN